MGAAFLWGALATASLVIGGLIATNLTLSRRTLGILMAFGAGTLISAVSYELVFEAVKLARGSGFPGFGFATGAFTFYGCDQLIAKLGAGQRPGRRAPEPSSLAIPMVLAIILDGIPESVVIGLGVLETRSVSLAMLVSVFISNLPEAIAGTVGMRSSGWSRRSILSLWLGIASVCALASAVGYAVFRGIPSQWLAFTQAFAGGAILMMLANSMIPESYERGGKLAGVFTVVGFLLSVALVIAESGH
jgi:ZIP family zinc transporter